MLRRSAASRMVTLLSKRAAGRDREGAGPDGTGAGLARGTVDRLAVGVVLGTCGAGETCGAACPPQPMSASSTAAAGPAIAGVRARRSHLVRVGRAGPGFVVTPAQPVRRACAGSWAELHAELVLQHEPELLPWVKADRLLELFHQRDL
jgi:hypothetical protein